MGKKAVIATIITLGVLGGAAYGGVKAYQNYQAKNTEANVYPIETINMFYFNEGVSSSGTVTNDHSQSVYALDDKKISEVYVEEGQNVSEGDPLIAYDMTLSALELEMKELDAATALSKLEAARRQLEKLRNTKPIPANPRPAPTPVPQPEPEPQPDPEPEPEEPPEKTGDAFNYITKASVPQEGSGTEDDPYVYLCMPDCYVLGEFINHLSAKKKKPVYVSLEIHKKNVLTGKLISAWEISGESGFPKMADDSMWSVSSRSQIVQQEEPEEIEEPEEPEEPEVPELPEPEEPEGYTAQELAELIREQEEEVRDLDLENRKVQIELEEMKRLSSDGIIKAELAGTVKDLGDKDSPPKDGTPFLTVAGSEGLYVSGVLSELQLGEVGVGQMIYANSWESNKSFEAEITEISTYPQNQNNAWGEGNPNVSYYPYTAYIQDTEGLRNGEYVDLTITKRQQEDGICIPKAYIRDEDGKKYVMKAGEDGCLVKQYVKTGRSLWGQASEILSGLTKEDKIAFPYGKEAKEGVKVKETDGPPEDLMMY